MRRAVQRELLPKQPGLAISLATGETYEEVVKREVKKRQRTKLEDSLAEEIRFFGLPQAVREFRFHPDREFRADFAWPDRKILVECQGGIFMRAGKGGHNRGAHMEVDYEKINEAQRLGWTVFQFGPKSLYRPKGGIQASKAIEFLYPILRGESLAEARGLPKQIAK